MGLTGSAVGHRAVDRGVDLRLQPGEKVVALAGNPNVGKSTVFNALTGLNQHTGNWPGKTVAIAQGRFTYQGRGYGRAAIMLALDFIRPSPAARLKPATCPTSLPTPAPEPSTFPWALRKPATWTRTKRWP